VKNLISRGIKFLNNGYAAGSARVKHETGSVKIKLVEIAQKIYQTQRLFI